MGKRNIYIVLGLALLGGAWALFRPELLFIKTQVNEEFPAAASAVSADSAKPLLSGAFHSVAHETKGTAAVHALAGGKRVLRLTDFMTSNGPDVRVYLVAATDASDNDTVKNAGFVELGKLKGTEGAQNYDVPVSVDLEKYRAVTIWCARFGVNFATAPLTPPAT
jgi:Electron transfer DM13